MGMDMGAIMEPYMVEPYMGMVATGAADICEIGVRPTSVKAR